MIKVPNEIFEWLVDSDLWRYEEIKETKAFPKDDYTTISIDVLLNGSLFLCLTNKVCEIRNLPYLNIKMTKAQFGNSIPTRLINWQLIQRQLKGLGIIIDNDVKNLIAHGDYMLAFETLKNCFKKLVNPDFKCDIAQAVLADNTQMLNIGSNLLKNISGFQSNSHMNTLQSALNANNLNDLNSIEDSKFRVSKSFNYNSATETPQKSRLSNVEQENESTFTSNKKPKASLFANHFRQKSQSLVMIKNINDQLLGEAYGRNRNSIVDKTSNGSQSNRNSSKKIVIPTSSHKKEYGESAMALFKTNDAQYHLYIKKKPIKIKSLAPMRVIGKQSLETHSSNYSFQQQYRKLAPNIDIEKCENVLEFLIIATSKVFNLEPKNCLNFFLNQSAYFNNLWIHAEEEHGYKRLLNFLKILDCHYEKVATLICNQNSEIFELFMNVTKNIWKTESFDVGRLYIEFFIKFLTFLKTNLFEIPLVDKNLNLVDPESSPSKLTVVRNAFNENSYAKRYQATNPNLVNQADLQVLNSSKSPKRISSNRLFIHWLDNNDYFFEGINVIVDKFPDLYPIVFDLFKTIESDNLDLWGILQKMKLAVNNNNRYFTFLRNMVEAKDSRIFDEFQNKHFLKKVIEELIDTFMSYGSKATLEKRMSIEDNVKKFKTKTKENNKDKKEPSIIKEKHNQKDRILDFHVTTDKTSEKHNTTANQKVEYSEFFSVTKILIKIIVNENFGKINFIKSFLDKIEKLLFYIPKYRQSVYVNNADAGADKKEVDLGYNIEDLPNLNKLSHLPLHQSIHFKKSKMDDISSQIEFAIGRKTTRISTVKEIFETHNGNIQQMTAMKIHPQIFLNTTQKIEIVLQLFRLFMCEKDSLQDIKTSLGVIFRKIIVFLDNKVEDVKEFLITLICKHLDYSVIKDFLKDELFPHFQEYLNKIFTKRLILSEWEVKLIKYYLNTNDLKTSEALVFGKNAFITFTSFFDISEFIFNDFVEFLKKNKDESQFLTLFLYIVKECEAKILDIERKTSYLSKEKLYVKISDLLEQQQINRKVVHLFKELQKRYLFAELIKELIDFKIRKVQDYTKLITVYFNGQYKAFIDEKNDGLKVIPNCKAYESIYDRLRNDDSDVLSKYELAAEIAVKSKGLLNDDKLPQIASDEIVLRLNDKKIRNLQRIRQQMDDYREFEKYIKEGKEADAKVKQNILNIQKQNDLKKVKAEKVAIMKQNKEKLIHLKASKQVEKNIQMLESQKGNGFASFNSMHAVEKTVVVEFMKEYSRFFRSIFNYYASKNNETCDLVASTTLNHTSDKVVNPHLVTISKKFMYPSNFWKMMVDFELNKYITFDDFNNEIVKSYFINEVSLKPKQDTTQQYYNILKEEKLYYQTFQEFFLNVFCRCFLAPKTLINPFDLMKMLKYLISNSKHKFLRLNEIFEHPLLYNMNNKTVYTELKDKLKKDHEAPLPSNFKSLKLTKFNNSSDFSETPIIISDILQDILNVDVLKEEKVVRLQYPQIKTHIEYVPKEKQKVSVETANISPDQLNDTLKQSSNENNGNSDEIKTKEKIINRYMQNLEEQNLQRTEQMRLRELMRKQRNKLLKAKIKDYRQATKKQDKPKARPLKKTRSFKQFDLRKYITNMMERKNKARHSVKQKPRLPLSKPLKDRLKKLKVYFSKLASNQRKIVEQANMFESQMKTKFGKYQNLSLTNCQKFKELSSTFHQQVFNDMNRFKESSIYNNIVYTMGPIVEQIFNSYTTYFFHYDYFEIENRQINLRILYIYFKQFGFIPKIYQPKEIVKFLNNYVFHIRKGENNEELIPNKFDFRSFNDLFYVLIIQKRDLIASLFDSQSDVMLEYAQKNHILTDKIDIGTLSNSEDKFEVNIVKAMIAFSYWNECTDDANYVLSKIQLTQ